MITAKYLVRALCAASICCLLAAPLSLWAWGKTGHEMVARMAMDYMNPAARQQVLAYLGNTTPEEASVWMDDMRSDKEYDFMKTWHYIDLPKGQPYTATTDDNAVNHILSAYRELGHKKTICADQAKTDIMVLFHLIGDLHQPLHAGYDNDRGGNDIKLTFLSQASNLHWIWDDELIREEHITRKDCEALYQTLTPEEINRIKTIDPVAWMRESRSFLDQVYAFKGNTIDLAYAHKNKALIVQRLLYAALRLAATMNQVMDGPAVPVTAQQASPASATSAMATISPAEAAQHIGETVTVCGKVYGGKYLENSKGAPTLINMGAAYPESPFTIVIFGEDRGNFGYKPEEYFRNKEVCITGKVKEYKGKAEIVVSNPKQVEMK